MLNPAEAAELLRLDYRDPTKLRTLLPLDILGVQARIVDVGADLPAFLCTGSNQDSDWHLANFRWWPLPHKRAGDCHTWHRGFARHAFPCYTFIKGWMGGANTRIGLIAGHSLGGAVAQIVGSAHQIPTYALAAPKPLWGHVQPAGADVVTVINGTRDPVCRTPPVGFDWVRGRVIWIDLGPSHGWRRASPYDRRLHAIEVYCERLKLPCDDPAPGIVGLSSPAP